MRPTLIRALALDVYARVMDHSELADRALHRALRAHPELHSVERRQVSEATFAMVRFAARHEVLLSQALASGRQGAFEQLPTPEQHRLRFAAALVEELGQSPQAAASAAGADARYVPALERVARGEAQWPLDPVARLAAERSVPPWFARRILDEYGDAADALAAALCVRAPLALRANLLKGTRDELLARLAAERVKAAPGALSPWSVVLEGRPNVFSLEAYGAGLFEVQDEGSQLLALATGAAPGQVVVDACAGAGGKTLALAAMMRNKGRLVAADVDASRMEDLRPRAKRAGAFLIEQKVIPAAREGDAPVRGLAGRADVVLVDAPCSGTGSWRRHADARWKLSDVAADAFPALQASILERYATTVRPGGRLVYATCSILRAENEVVAEGFAAAHPEFEPVAVEGLPASALDAAGRVKLLPHVHGCDGFFAAAFRRRERP